MGQTALQLAMLMTVLGSASLAAFLLLRAGGAAGSRPLAAFLAHVGLWASGVLFPGSWGTAAMTLEALGAAIFVHFAARLTQRGARFLPWVYAVGGAATLAAFIYGPGEFISWPGAGILFRHSGEGLISATTTMLLAGLGQMLLIGAWRGARGLLRRQLAVVMASSGLGLASVMGLAPPVLGIEVYPWPLLLLPAYVAVLTYGVLRYELMADLERRRAEVEQQRLAELGALAATVAHDLRNPLNIIAMAVAGAEPAVRAEVRAQIDRMDALVHDLLDYAKPWRIDPAAVPLAALVAEAAGEVTVENSIAANLEIRADPLRLRQALANLLANAAAAGGRVAILAETLPDAVLVHVCDDGAGIPPDIRDTLFQPFVSRGPGGTGLGLAIVAKVMAAHGGSVALTNRPGWTTCFTLRFPNEH
ncbi:MAG: ATP-binding protein [Alphaproteobacteria bacterium]